MSAHLDGLVQHLHHLSGEGEQLPDALLLERFASQRDEHVFAALLHRHGPMVLRVCRRVLADRHLADDAFQATFVVLARQAGAISRPDSLAAWLYGVAFRVAHKALRGQRQAAPLAETDTPDRGRDPLAEVSGRELLAILDEEVNRLPERYRLAVVLCCLEGLGHEAAARRLGWSRGALRARLERGRARLHARLRRRGLELSVVLPAVELARAATAPQALLQATPNLAVLSATGMEGSMPARVLALAEAGLPGVPAGRTAAALAVILGLVLAGTSLLAHGLGGGQHALQRSRTAAAPATAARPATDLLGDPLPSGALLRLGSLRWRHAARVLALAYSPDGKRVAAGGLDGVVYLRDAVTGKEVHRLEGHQGGVHALAFSPDGKTLAVASVQVHLWDPATGKLLRSLQARKTLHRSVVFSANGKLIAAGGDEGAWLWDLKGRLRGEFRAGKEGVSAVALSPDGKYLATGADRDGIVRLWCPATHRVVRRFSHEAGSVCAVLFSSDGARLVSTAGDTRIWETGTGKVLYRYDGHLNGGFLALSRDGRRLALPGSDREILVVDLDSGTKQQGLGGCGPVRAAGFSPDGKRLAFSGWDQVVRLWDLDARRELPSPGGHDQGVSCLAVAPDGRTIITAGFEGTIRLWQADTGKPIRQVRAFSSEVRCLALSPDGRLLAAGSHQDARIRLWRLPRGRKLRPLPAHNGGVCSLAFSPDGKLLLSAGKDRRARLWSSETWKERRTLPDHGADVWAVAFSPDGRLLATAAGGGRCVRLWDVSTGRLAARFGNHIGVVTGLIFSPDGRLLASVPRESMINLAEAAVQEDAIRLWEVATGREVRRLTTWFGIAHGAAFSPDGKTLVSGHDRHLMHLWEVSTGRSRGRVAGHMSGLSAVAIFPDGRRVVSGSYDSTALVWDRDALARRQARKAATDRQLWEALAREESGGAAAIGALLADPARTVALLRKRPRPARPVDGARIKGLVSDLGSDTFEVRQQADRQLKALEFLAEPALRQALGTRPPLEMRRRIERLLGALEKQRLAPAGEQLRLVRVVEVLERLDTTGSRAVLEKLANGPPGDRGTEEAKAALRRMR
jgi:RNA polymerase sigma factor (sigma-70 family)